MRFDTSLLQRGDQQLAALGVGSLRASEAFLHVAIGPECGHECLQQMADPADAEGLASFDACNRSAIAGQEGQAQVWPKRLRNRADHGPVLA